MAVTREVAPDGGRRGVLMDRLIRWFIVGSGVVCFVLLAWVHLGWGARLFPPPPTAPRQTAAAGPYTVTLALASGQLTQRGPNALDLTLRDAAGHAVTAATVRVHPTMTTMAMTERDAPATATPSGTYRAQPVFNMPGTYRLNVVVVAAPGAPEYRATFDVSVRA